MTKISIYPVLATPSLSDMLIGTDVNNMDMTKNFTIADILSLAGTNVYVPYVGAAQNVDLGAYDLSASKITSTSWMKTDEIRPLTSNPFYIKDITGDFIGLKFDFTNYKYSIGDYLGLSNGMAMIIDEPLSNILLGSTIGSTFIIVDEANQYILLSNALFVDNGVGTLGQVLTSQGPGQAPSWQPLGGLAYVPYTGATLDVDLGVYSITSYDSIITNQLSADGSVGTSGQVLTSQGAGLPTVWATAPALSYVPYTGATNDVDLGAYSLFANQIDLFDALYLNGSPGSPGQVLTSTGGSTPTWTTPLSSAGFVPYIGATSDVDLAGYDLFADRVITTGAVYTSSIVPELLSSIINIGSTTVSYMKFDTAVGRVELNRPLYVNGSIGSLGQVLTSQGAGLPPTWSTSSFVPYTGATSSVNLGVNNITASAFIKLGGTSSQFLKADGSVDSNTYLTSATISGLVPYTGATGNVNLGANSITSNSFIKAGGTSSQFLKANGSVDSNAYVTSATISGLVPYTGATGAVDLGTNTLSVGDVNISANKNISLSSNNNLYLGNNSQIYLVNNCGINVTTGSQINVFNNGGISFSPNSYLLANGMTGTPGQVLSSGGGGSGPTWNTIPDYLFPYYGSFYDTTTQTTVGNENLAMKLNTTDATVTSGFSITNSGASQPTRITCTQTGVYNVQFSAQLHNTGGGASQVWIWFRKNGVDLADSATTVTMQNNDLLVASWNYFVNFTSVGDYIEIMWRVDNNHVEIQRNTTVTGVPDIPSVIATINRIR